MSFAEQFRQQALPIFRHVYLRINELESLSNEEASNAKSRSSTILPSVVCPHDYPFRKALDAELERLRNFIEAYSEELWIRLNQILQRLEQCSGNLKSPNKKVLNEEALDQVEKECSDMAESLISLEEFRRQNTLAAALLLQQHEMQHPEKNRKKLNSLSEVNPVVLKQMEEALMGQQQQDYDPILLTLSRAYSKIRKLRDRVLGEESVWQPPDTFTRNTKKYWIHPADVLRVKCTILKYLPILIFGRLIKESSPASRLIPLKEQYQKASSLVSSVYLDNEGLQTYHDRLIREHEATLVRFRWYGKQSIHPEETVFVERKVHKDSWTGEKSYKERGPLPCKEVQDFLQGKTVPSINEKNHKITLLKDLQDHIMLRNEVRMSLDTNLRMIKESNSMRNDGLWCRSLEEKLEDSEIVNFPYAVFEIKLQGDDPPDWVDRLLSTGLLVEVPKFSKFLHGTAILYGSQIHNSPTWFVPSAQGFMESATIQEMADTSDPFVRGAVNFLFPKKQKPEVEEKTSILSRSPHHQMQVSTLCHVPDNHTVLSEVVVLPSGPQHSSNSRKVVRTSVHGPASTRMGGNQPMGSNIQMTPTNRGRGEEGDKKWRDVFSWKRREEEERSGCHHLNQNRAASLVRTRIEPKTFFANERTFLSWLTVAVMVMFLGLSLLDAPTTGAGLGLFGANTSCRQTMTTTTSSQPITLADGTTVLTNTSQEKNGQSSGLECNVARVAGALIAPMALVLMIYSLYIYRKRSIQILRRETVRYDDPHGPVILTILLVTVLFLAYILSIA